MPPASPKLSLCLQHRSSPQPCALLWVPAAARPSQLSPPPPLPPGGVSAPSSRTSRMGGRERGPKLGWVRWRQAGGCLGLGTANPPRTAPSQHPQGSGPQLVSSAGSPAPCGCLSSPLLRHYPNQLKTLQKKRESAPSPGCAPCLACPTAQPQVLCPGGCSPRWENGNSPTLPTTTSQPGHGPILHSQAKPPRSTREPPPSTTRCCGVSPSHPIPGQEPFASTLPSRVSQELLPSPPTALPWGTALPRRPAPRNPLYLLKSRRLRTREPGAPPGDAAPLQPPSSHGPEGACPAASSPSGPAPRSQRPQRRGSKAASALPALTGGPRAQGLRQRALAPPAKGTAAEGARAPSPRAPAGPRGAAPGERRPGPCSPAALVPGLEVPGQSRSAREVAQDRAQPCVAAARTGASALGSRNRPAAPDNPDQRPLSPPRAGGSGKKQQQQRQDVGLGQEEAAGQRDAARGQRLPGWPWCPLTLARRDRGEKAGAPAAAPVVSGGRQDRGGGSPGPVPLS